MLYIPTTHLKIYVLSICFLIGALLTFFTYWVNLLSFFLHLKLFHKCTLTKRNMRSFLGYYHNSAIFSFSKCLPHPKIHHEIETDYLWHRAKRLCIWRILKPIGIGLLLDALVKQVTKIGFSHLAWEGLVRALYFIVLFHLDSCDLGVLFGGDKKGKVNMGNCSIWERIMFSHGTLTLDNYSVSW